MDCEKQCELWQKLWLNKGRCPHSWANDDGGFWCFEHCGGKDND